MRRLRFYAILLVCLGLGLWGLRRFPVPGQGLVDSLQSLALLLVLVFSILGLGRAILSRFKVYTISLKEELSFSFGLGLAGLALLAQGLAALGALTPMSAALLLASIVASTSDHLSRFLHLLRRGFRGGLPEEHSPGVEWLMQAALALTAVTVAMLALAPVTHYDALVYHLALPQRWAQGGPALPLQGNLFSWLPGAGEHLALLCLQLDGPRLYGLLNLAMAFGLGLALWDCSLRFLPKARPSLVAALCLTQPLASLAFGIPGGDGHMALLSFLAFNAFLRSMAERNHRLQGSWALMTALLLGAAMAAKPTALLSALALLALALWRAWREPNFRRPMLWMGAVGLALVPLLPWIGRNLWMGAQPFTPFGIPALGLEPMSRTYLEHIATHGLKQEAWWRQLALPWALVFDPARFGSGGLISPLMLAVLPASLLLPRHREARLALAFSALVLLFWALTGQVLRYLLQALPVYCLFAGYVLSEGAELAASKTFSALFELLVCALLLLGAAQTAYIAVKDFDPARVALGLESPDAYLARKVNTTGLARWARSRIEPDAGLLVLGDARTAYLPGRPTAATVFDQHPLSVWLREAQNAKELNTLVRKNGFKYVLINREEWRRVASGSGPHHDLVRGPREQALLEAWVQGYLSLMRSEAGASIYRIRHRELPSPPAGPSLPFVPEKP